MSKASDSDGNGIEDYWTEDIAGLYFFQPKNSHIPLRMIDYSTAIADRFPSRNYPRVVPSPKSGYWFKTLKVEGSVNGRNVDRFAVCAYPANYSSRDRWTYILSEGGTIFMKDLQGKTISEWPENPPAQGWSRLE